ncbi:hypothetical protein REPUB_Repub16aG0013200 [Reevesia pubescens]
MEDTNSSTKEVTAQETPVYHYPAWYFHEVVRAILRCLGLEETHEIQSCPKKEDDTKVNNIRPRYQASAEEGAADPASTTDYSDPPSTVTNSAADPPSTNEDLVVSLSTPTRPGTSSGRGPQIN